MELSLKAFTRDLTGKKVQKLREKGKVPAVVYGPGEKNINLAVDYVDFEKIYEQAGESTLVNLEIGEEKIPVLIHQVSYHPLTDKVEHIDFYRVKYGQKLTAAVELNFVGVSKAVKELGGILVTNIEEIEIECLPKDLVSEIDVDLSKLETFEDVIFVKDLPIPEGIKVLTDPEEVVASVASSRMEEEAPAKAEESASAEAENKEEETKEAGEKEAK